MWAFVLGVIAVTAGVLLHAADVLDGPQQSLSRSHGMPIGPDMIVGMVAIVGGVAIAAYGLLPQERLAALVARRRRSSFRRPRTRRSPGRTGR